MATIEKINVEIEKVKGKIAEYQKRLKTLEAQKLEEENLEIIKVVRAYIVDSSQLKSFINEIRKTQISEVRNDTKND